MLCSYPLSSWHSHYPNHKLKGTILKQRGGKGGPLDEQKAEDDFGSGFVSYGSFLQDHPSTCMVSKPEEEKVCWIAGKTDVKVSTSRNEIGMEMEKMEI